MTQGIGELTTEMNTAITTQGVIYIAVGEKYIAEALASAASLKAHSPGLHVCMFTDRSLTSPWVDQVLPLAPGPYHPTLKPRCMSASPYERTLFLDTDTYVCADISNMFAVLDRFDLAASHDNTFVSGSAQTYLSDQVMRVPEAFMQFNSGVLLYRRSPEIIAMFEQWAQLVDLFMHAASAFREKGHAKDQTALREALYESDLRFATLPREYNCRYHSMNTLHDEVKILHGRRLDLAEVAALINGSRQRRVHIYHPYGLRIITWGETKEQDRSAHGAPSGKEKGATRPGKRHRLVAQVRRSLSGWGLRRTETGPHAPDDIEAKS